MTDAPTQRSWNQKERAIALLAGHGTALFGVILNPTVLEWLIPKAIWGAGLEQLPELAGLVLRLGPVMGFVLSIVPLMTGLTMSYLALKYSSPEPSAKCESLLGSAYMCAVALILLAVVLVAGRLATTSLSNA